jgi:hypothetical protein
MVGPTGLSGWLARWAKLTEVKGAELNRKGEKRKEGAGGKSGGGRASIYT